MTQLNRQLLRPGKIPAEVSCGVIVDLPEKVVQFGEGNFLRGFADWMIDTMNNRGLFNGHAVVVQPMKQGMVKVLNEQDGIYTLLLRGTHNGQPVETRQIITAVSRGIDPYENWKATVEVMLQPEIRVVISNTTEAGITYVEE